MESIFDKVGKKMPYRVPNNYFEEISEQFVNNALRETQPQRKAQKFFSIQSKNFWYSSIASVAAIMLCAFLLTPSSSNSPVEEYNTALNDYCNSISESEYETEGDMLAELDAFLEYQYN